MPMTNDKSTNDLEVELERQRARVDACIHDLRQPLQTLVLLQGRLARTVDDDDAQRLIARVDEALTSMTDALDALAQTSAIAQHAPSAPLLVEARVLNISEPDLPHHLVGPTAGPVIFVIDDDDRVRAEFHDMLRADGYRVEEFASSEAFSQRMVARDEGLAEDGCLLVDAYLPGMGGLELLQQLQRMGSKLPAIMVTGNSDVSMAVDAMKAGALDFLEKPVRPGDLLSCIERAVERSRDHSKLLAWRTNAADQLATLTLRQRQIMHLVLAGHPSKNIASDLGISQRTVENHRALIMKKTGSKSLPALARLAVAAAAALPD
jgi:two-component system, chemotaxis family, CheB/CheR fusion protein